MNDEQKIHLLVQELIPVINDLEDAPKEIIFDHIQICSDCHILYKNASEFDENMPTLNEPDPIELKPLKRLAQYNTGLKLGLVAIRAIILFYVLYTNFMFSDAGPVDYPFLQFEILFFYTPSALFLLIFTFTFFNKKWLYYSLGVDLFVILLLGRILQFIL